MTNTLDRGANQFGERQSSLDQAWQKGLRAVAELGLTAEVTAASDNNPGAWTCRLLRDGVPVPGGFGSGKGNREAARVGAVFEALEHHLSGRAGLPPAATLRDPHAIAAGPLRSDVAVTMLTEGPARPIACLRYESLTGDRGTDVPIFLSMPDFLAKGAAELRAGLGDHYDYTTVGRYSANNGWAAGADATEAMVHALNEIIERDALSLLLIEHFLAARPIRLVDRATLPGDLMALLASTEEAVGARVHLIDMATDLGIPAYYAYLPSAPGQPARMRGCGASLSRHYAIARSLTELVQLHAMAQLGEREEKRTVWTTSYLELHACYLADFSPGIPNAHVVAYEDSEAPATPSGHLKALLAALREAGLPAYVRQQWMSENLAVVNVFVPGLERFMLVTDGQLVVPGPRGVAAR
ncbi:YcaO-like family protein [Kutzneria sp. 744]|uniref:YcaO-like family protein n=1 Tax=Kutzneria sp. (strain 744) TaxID=345341 RepID=UPI0003EECCAC|nr:YcaO-like family protein [Kutzneria sp. 744]EWM18075.1 hypothetical protein KUTG_08379 [Kutzneria sp. 744]